MIQSNKFDYLLDLDGEVIHAAEDELYVPITYPLFRIVNAITDGIF